MTIANGKSAGWGCFTVKVEYEDIAGAYGGWFLIVVQSPTTQDLDTDSNPANGPSYGDNVRDFALYGPTTSGIAAYGGAMASQVNARLERMLGVGHSAKWSATLPQTVTPASIDDDW